MVTSRRTEQRGVPPTYPWSPAGNLPEDQAGPRAGRRPPFKTRPVRRKGGATWRPHALESPMNRSPPACLVLEAADLARAVTRIAHEIAEHSRGPENRPAGIPTRGVPRRRLAERLAEIKASGAGGIAGRDCTATTCRQATALRGLPRCPTAAWTPSCAVDDVLFSGRTIRAARRASDLGRPPSGSPPDRPRPPGLPIRADHVGKNLPTAPAERVRVRRPRWTAPTGSPRRPPGVAR
jgi:pyrimidine operon attenuation protein/uracil phosphoribosyltransferase